MDQNVGLRYPFYSYEDEDYCQFMIRFMQFVEIRKFKEKEIIHYELEECNEILFVLSGKYNVGYEINKEQYWRRQFGQSTIIGGFNCEFNKRLIFLYRAKTDMVCYAIRKANWIALMKEFSIFRNDIAAKFFQFYYLNIYSPILKRKQQDINFYDKRRDYE